jgi:hypothetical protein
VADGSGQGPRPAILGISVLSWAWAALALGQAGLALWSYGRGSPYWLNAVLAVFFAVFGVLNQRRYSKIAAARGAAAGGDTEANR